MKLSKREKILIIVFAVVLVLGGYYKFIYTSQVDRIKELTAKQEEYNNKIAELKKDALLNTKIKKDIKIANAKIYENSKDFFPSIIEEKIIVILDDMINKTNIQCDAINISEIGSDNISKKDSDKKDNEKNNENYLQGLVDAYNNIDEGKVEEEKENSADNEGNEEKSEKDSEKENNSPGAENLSVSLNFKGSYDDVMKFIDEIKDFYKRIIIKNISFSAEEEYISGTMTLDFYAVPKFLEEDIDYNEWNFDGEYGKTNMFKDNAVGKIEIGSEEEQKSDFSMSVRPISSDLPTIVLGKTDNKNSYVFADNEGIENIEFYVTEEGGQYYYKYKTNKDAYPKKFDGEGEIFNSSGDSIIFKIFSRSRVSEKDVSGVNIKVFNSTDKKLQIFVEDDDKSRPRVNIIKGEGNIAIKGN